MPVTYRVARQAVPKNPRTSPGFAVVHQARFQRECPPWALAEWGVHAGLAPRGLVNVVNETSVNDPMGVVNVDVIVG
jgi:hypothetical protein